MPFCVQSRLWIEWMLGLIVLSGSPPLSHRPNDLPFTCPQSPQFPCVGATEACPHGQGEGYKWIRWQRTVFTHITRVSSVLVYCPTSIPYKTQMCVCTRTCTHTHTHTHTFGGVGFELKASNLLGSGSSTWATLPACFCFLVIFQTGLT
jgi:hypothetical protein